MKYLVSSKHRVIRDQVVYPFFLINFFKKTRYETPSLDLRWFAIDERQLRRTEPSASPRGGINARTDTDGEGVRCTVEPSETRW